MTDQLTADQRLAVMDLIADYADKLESGDLDGYVENFTPDGVFEGRTGRYEGHEAIRALVSHLFEIGQDGPGGNRHILGLPRIAATAEGCTAQTYFVIPAGAGEDSVLIRSIGQYTDRVVQHAGRWRFAHRYLDQVLRRTGGQ
jgi:ketosteroid isomerase-like protein